MSPPRRRRPALSCTLCRRRKLKCDRGLPCGQCVKSKASESCEYAGFQKGQVSNTRRLGSTPPPFVQPSGNHLTPSQSGVYVFDAKHKQTSNRITKPPSRVEEVHELRSRVQALENALSRPGAAMHTPETLGYDSFSEGGRRAMLDSQNLTEEVESLPSGCFRGKKSKSRHCGRSHWAVSVSFFKDIGIFMRGLDKGKSKPKDSDYTSMRKFKKEVWNREREEHQRAYRDQAFKLEEMIPSKEIADELLELYLTTFETTYRILHVPTFLRQYELHWSGSQPTDMVFIAKLLVLMAASSCFYSQNTRINERSTLQRAAVGWTMTVQSWMSSVFVSSNINLDMLQIQCLLLIARQANATGGNLVWISSGSLVRAAMIMGLHRDPSRFSRMSKFWAEMRRRLWATIIELDVQSSLDGGMLPSIDLNECDCGPPSNWDDADLTEDMVEDPVPKTLDTLARNNVQGLLSNSLPTRIRIAKLTNSLKYNLPYDEALRLSEELMHSMNQALNMFQECESNISILRLGNLTFAKSFYMFIMRRYLLVLHRPFFLSVLRAPKFSYSRKVCLESSLEMLSLLGPSDHLETGPSSCIGQLGGGMYRDEFFHAAITICVELSIQADEQSRSVTAFETPRTGTLTDMVQTQQTVLVTAVERTMDALGSRISSDGNGCKPFFFLTMVFASVKARLKGEDPLKNVEYLSMKAVRECQDIMKGVSWKEIRKQDEISQPLQANLESATSDIGFDPTAPLFPADLTNLSPIEFGNLFDMADYGAPDLWNNEFLTGL
ncbi:hypothetical protein MW887_003684 [Aspergillus wentii]|nr:hypothetical protein MW887_003684 [Aspergillus wentii]